MNPALKEFLEVLKPEDFENADSWSDIESIEALKRTHSMTVAMLEHAHRLIKQAEHDLSEQNHRIKSLENLAVTDEMTGLLNRRGFEDAVQRELERLQRGQAQGGAFALLDLDKFKPINDTHGHLAGDLCLQAIGRCLQSMIRTTDVAGRLGGDEFAFYLGDIDAERALVKLENIDRKINELSLVWDGTVIDIRASLGFVMVDKNVGSYRDIYNKADREMYRVKTLNDGIENRRNQILDATSPTAG